MAKVKFDVSGSDPKKAFAGGGVQPKPGVYRVKLIDVKVGHKRDDESAKRLEVVAEVQDKAYKGARLYDYIGFDSNQEWKMDQFLQCMGVATGKKRKGQFDTDDLIGEVRKIRVKGDSYNGEYKAALAAWLPPSDEDDDDDDADFDEDDDELEEEDDDAEDDLDDEDEEDEEDEDEDEEEDDVPPYDEWELADLKAEVKSRGIKPKTTKKADLIKALEADDESEDEDEDDDDEEPF